ncbi:OsmC family protein [Methanocrinis sp.]|uniref:OsmC family protein n=1 Tax=Methanocrinis sp. TaxID=3101522 RepID=UPI003D117324
MSEMLNGIDVLRLQKTIEAVGREPEKGRFTIRARTEWAGGCRCRTFIERAEGAKGSAKFFVEADEPPALLGRDLAPNAAEYVLHALASCLAVGLVLRASLVGIEIEGLKLSLEGDIDLNNFFGLSEDPRPGLQSISVSCAVTVASDAADAPREKIEELCREVVRRSAVMDVIENPVPVSVSVSVSLPV